MNFKFERLPEFCYLCGKIDHVMKACSSPRTENAERKFGVWMQAQSNAGDRVVPLGKKDKLSQRPGAISSPSGSIQLATPSLVPDPIPPTLESDSLRSSEAKPGEKSCPISRQPLQNLTNLNVPPLPPLPDALTHWAGPVDPLPSTSPYTLCPSHNWNPVRPNLCGLRILPRVQHLLLFRFLK